MRLENIGKVIESDVLVIGGGVTGLWAAIKAKEYVERVIIVDKGPRDWGSTQVGCLLSAKISVANLCGTKYQRMKHTGPPPRRSANG